MGRIGYVGGKMKRFCAVILGLVFFTAGTLKLMDPVGTTLIVREYLNFLHLGFLRVLAGTIAETFALTETLLGVCLVTGVFRKVAAWAVAVLLGGFTLLTLLLWILNPPMDCGCFGEAMHLTHFQSFAKNVVLMFIAAAAFLPFKDFGKPRNSRYVTFALAAAAVLSFAVYSKMFIPMLELTPFNLSSRLAAASAVQESDGDEYISTFIYEKNGKTGVFTLNNLPDSTWTFVETKTVRQQSSGRDSGFPELPFRDAAGEYRDSLAAGPLVMVVSVPEPGKMKTSAWRESARFLGDASAAGFTPLLLVASDPVSFPALIAREKLSTAESMLLMTSVYYSDYKTLISLNRSNGGAVYFNDGNLISKWAARNLPGQRKIGKLLRQDSTEVMLDSDGKGRLAFEAYMLYVLALMLVIV